MSVDEAIAKLSAEVTERRIRQTAKLPSATETSTTDEEQNAY